ncbi:universal stress protein [Streptomyces resistomycificus]|uniref:Stress-inducible protein n=1 Tax=Streptomyces resistomycificus TaxID=67356 RepID=A0A0L8KSK1_9ACTN|nr:universal stress protein [Streptomyces resistomycificus]KOG28923.1 stress-inducible protein [Streptomyces resistomycificus]KUN94452.1 stress-inducible protein [Streptomyces resistomycificus]
MLRTITVGLDGSQESMAATEWAAREAKLRGLPLKIVHVWEPVPEPMAQAPLLGAETQQHWTERIPREAAEGVRLRHPGVEVRTEQVSGHPGNALAEAAESAELLVLGSRGFGGIGGFMVGSVSLSTVAHADRPVVLVRAREVAADEHELDPAGVPSAAAPFRPVVLGLDVEHPDETLIEFAFDAAKRRATSLRVVHGWNLPPYYAYGTPANPALHEALASRESEAVAEVLRPWRQKFPDVEVVEVSRYGSPAVHVVDASHDASLVVVGRRIRRNPFGAHIGHVTHAVLHHSTVPVAVVPHA